MTFKLEQPPYTLKIVPYFRLSTLWVQQEDMGRRRGSLYLAGVFACGFTLERVGCVVSLFMSSSIQQKFAQARMLRYLFSHFVQMLFYICIAQLEPSISDHLVSTHLKDKLPYREKQGKKKRKCLPFTSTFMYWDVTPEKQNSRPNLPWGSKGFPGVIENHKNNSLCNSIALPDETHFPGRERIVCVREMSETTDIFIKNNYDSSQVKETVVTSVKQKQAEEPSSTN